MPYSGRKVVSLCSGLALLGALSSCLGSPPSEEASVGAGGASNTGGTAAGGTSQVAGGAGAAGTTATCPSGGTVCVGQEVRVCENGQPGATKETCDEAVGAACVDGACRDECAAAKTKASNVGCEFWAVDLDQQDKYADPASAPWAVVIANDGQHATVVKIETNEAPPGAPQSLQVYKQVSIPKGGTETVVMPTREVDCGAKPNDYGAPGTCLSSRALRVTSTFPIAVYQLNSATNSYSNDASLLLPTHALGRAYRVIGWPAAHPYAVPPVLPSPDRTYITIVGTQSGTQVEVTPRFKLKGNGPGLPATAAGQVLKVTLGPFDVLNLESDDSTMSEFMADPWVSDLTGSLVLASQPVAVFSGTETATVPGSLPIPKPKPTASCCADHLEEQMLPIEATGRAYVVPRSPLRSTLGTKEVDILRFVGVAEPANVTTSMPAPFDKFTLQPGQRFDAWTDDDVVIDSDKPIAVGQVLVGQESLFGPAKGDPSLTVFAAADQFRSTYTFAVPVSWAENWLVFALREGSSVTVDGTTPNACDTRPIGQVAGSPWTGMTCKVDPGAHTVSSTDPFSVAVYGYGEAGSYAFIGGIDVRKIYQPPIPGFLGLDSASDHRTVRR